MLHSALFRSESTEWETPQALFDELATIFRFTLDACATATNTKCERYFSLEEDALSRSWGTEVVWMNPPYGRQVGAFVKKAFEAAMEGATVTAWWHEYVKQAVVIPLRGRLQFKGAPHKAPFPSAIVIFFGGVLGRAVRS